MPWYIMKVIETSDFSEAYSNKLKLIHYSNKHFGERELSINIENMDIFT